MVKVVVQTIVKFVKILSKNIFWTLHYKQFQSIIGINFHIRD